MGEVDGRPREWNGGILRFNPIVTFLGMACLWGMTAYCMSSPDAALDVLLSWRTWVSDKFTWFYIGTQDVWFIFAIVLYFSKYGGMKLCAKGSEDKPPEFSNIEYFMMIFSAGVGVGLFFFAVDEPIYHYEGDNRYTIGGYRTDNERAQWAMTLTIFHWGVHGWIPYTIVACCLGFVHFRMGLPMSMRSCFFPLIGNKVNGWIGDLIDVFSIVVVVAGVCTSLGLGVVQIAAGMLWIDPGLWDSTDEDTHSNVLIVMIWVITSLATVSVVSGIHVGIKYLSAVAFIMGGLMWTVVFFADDTWFLLNTMTQTIGHYFQNIVGLSFITDAFQQLPEGGGAAPDGLAVPNFMDNWTVFYWGWWIAWSPFVGMFVARISRGRSIREVIHYSLSAPLLYAILWFSVFGGAGIKMQNTATTLSADLTVDETFADSGCYATDNPAHSPVCNLFGAESSTAWFMLLDQYYGLGNFLGGLSIVTIVLYFITSSDSGSLVVDYIAANGQEGTHPAQRILWAFTEGGLATGLIKAGGSSGTAALQSASISAGLPFTVVICLLCTSLWRACGQANYDIAPVMERKNFSFSVCGGVFDVMEWIFSLGKHRLPSRKLVLGFLFAMVCPGLFIHRANEKLSSSVRTSIFVEVLINMTFYTFVLLHLAQLAETGLWTFAWVFYIGFCLLLSIRRSSFRRNYGILGTFTEDFFATLFLYPQVCLQMSEQVLVPAPSKEEEDALSVMDLGAGKIAEKGSIVIGSSGRLMQGSKVKYPSPRIGGQSSRGRGFSPATVGPSRGARTGTMGKVTGASKALREESKIEEQSDGAAV